MKRAAQIGLAVVSVALGGCHNRERSAPPSPAAEAVAALRARPASPLGAARATRFEIAAGLRPAFEAGDRVTAKVSFPARATGAVHLQDAATGLSVDVSLTDARDVPAAATAGYLVYVGAHASGAALVHRPIPEGTEDFLAFESRPAAAEVRYQLALGPSVSGLRLVAGTLELLDAVGAPRLRVAPPYLVGANGERTEATLAVEGCAVDTRPAAPWGRPVTAPGAAICAMRVSWPGEMVTYPAVLDPRWTTTGAMMAARQDHTATLLSNNKVLVAGGRATNSATTGIASAELFDPATATWAAAAAGMTARFSATATQLNTSSNSTTSGMVLIAGGINNSASVTTAQLYSAATGLWTTAASLNVARHMHTATLMPNGNVLVAGGMTNTAVLNNAAIYNPASGTGTWTAVSATMSSARRSHTATLLTSSNTNFNNKVLIVGGNSGGTTSLTTVQLFDTTALTWSTTTALSPAREGHTATKLANGNVLITGGKNVATFLGTTQAFTIPASGTAATWASAGTMSSLRWAHTATLLSTSVLNNGSVLVAGGSNGTSPVTSADLWNGTSTWTATTALATAVQGHTATLLASGGVVLAGGSNNGTASVGAGVVYDPSFALSCTTNSQCATGFCVSGVCCDTACSNGCGACNLSGKVGTCSPLTGGTVCRAAAGECDVAETCNGSSTACPADGKMGNGMACTDDANPCTTDLCNGTSATCQHAAGNNGTACPDDGNPCTTDRCNGTSTTCQHAAGNNGTACPDDGNPCTTDRCNGTSATCQHAAGNNGTACLDDGNPCTTDRCDGINTTCQHAAGNNGTACPDDGNPCTTDHCDGINTTCQHPAGNSGTVCRGAAGECDVAETCTGSSATCPTDGKKPSGSACTDDGNVCTTDKCDGSNVACQHAAGNPGTVCRVAAGECDVAETCTGSSATCPTDGKKPSGSACTDDGNVCTTDKCDGSNVACQHAPGNPGIVCRASGGECDPAETCTGTSPTCPTDAKKPPGTPCTDDGNVCTTDTCNGSVAACQHPAGNPGTVCRTSAGECDLAETCTGTSPTCPTDAKKPPGTACTDDGNVCTTDKCDGSAAACQHAAGNPGAVCRVAASACDVAETCSGTSTTCPADGFQPNGTTCDDGNACTKADTCQGGACNGGNPVVCAPDQCHSAGSCDRATGYCNDPRLADGTACDDGNRCSVGDSCHAGTCMPGLATGCTGAGQTNYVSVIDLGSTQEWSYATDINNHGEVAGTDGLLTDGIYQLGLPGSRAFRWSESDGLVYLPWPGTQSYASSVNDAGVFSMTAGLTPGAMLPCRYDPAIDSQPRCQPQAGNGGGINAGGTMTGGGYYDVGGGAVTLRMFRINTGVVQVLPSLSDPNPTYMQAVGSAIDVNGTVVGAQLRNDGDWHAIRFTDARGTESLNSLLPPGSSWDLHAANHVSPTQIVGWGDHDGLGRAYRLTVAADGSFGGITDLGIPATYASDAPNVVSANGFNASGEIAGSVYDAIPFWPQRAYVYTDAAGAVDLNTLIDPQSQWVLLAAFAINDNHEVVGYGTYNGLLRAYKLTLPELTCQPIDSCHVASRDPLTGACTSQVKPNGAPCDDGNACTRNDACQAGVCSGSTPVACQAPDACHDAGTCNPGTARAQPPSRNGLIGWWQLEGDGKDASGGGHDLTIEGNAAAAPGRFGLGMKFDGASCLTAPIWDDARMQGATGLTMMAWVNTGNGYACPAGPLVVMGRGFDYSAGTQCQGPGTPDLTGLARAAGDQTWAFPGGFGQIPRDNWTLVAITWDHQQIRHYLNGQLVGSNPKTGTSSDVDPTFNIGCMNAFDVFPQPSETRKFIGTVDEAMLYRRPLADAEIAAYYAASDPCLHANRPDGTACDDGNACTQNEACAGGACVGGAAVTCPPPDQCHTAGACVPATGCAALPPKPDGAACNDSNACTRLDLCEAGVCIGANPVPCVAPDACHAATCDPGTGACSITTGTGTCDIGAFDYDKAGRLVRDRSAQLQYDAYDQLLQVTPVTAPPAITHLPVEELAVAGSTQTIPGRPNRNGHVAVGAVLASGISHAVLFKGEGPPLDINLAAGVSTSLYPSSVNGVDTVAGSLAEPDGSTHAFRYDAAGLHDLGNPGDSTFAYDINDANQEIGFFTTGGVAHGYRYADGIGFQEIGTLGGAQSWAWNIDDLGAVVASAETGAPPGTGVAAFGHAALYQDLVGIQDLNNLVDPTLGVTLVIANDHVGDWIVGTDLAGIAQHGYRLRMSTGALDEPTWAGATAGTAVNAAGDAVGWGYTDAANTQQAAWILSDRTGFANLNDLIDPASGWNLKLAEGIDDLGDVVGWGTHNGVVSAFRLRIPLHSSGTGGPTVAEVHTYGYDNQRTSTTTGLGTSTASTQFWITQDYSEHDGIREHYLRVGNRIVAKLTMQPPPGGAMGLVADGRRASPDRGDLVAEVLLALLLLGGLGVTGAGVVGRKRRPAWVALATGPVLLFFVSSCEMLGSNRRSSAETLWQRIETVYFHDGIAAGPVLTTNSDGTLREERRYEPFGQPVDANVAGTIGPVDFRREQQNSLGKLTDPASGWSYHGARWMQPQTARWTSPDPIAKGPRPEFLSDPWNINPYAYVSQRPTKEWDPTGATGEGTEGANGHEAGPQEPYEPGDPKVVDENMKRVLAGSNKKTLPDDEMVLRDVRGTGYAAPRERVQRAELTAQAEDWVGTSQAASRSFLGAVGAGTSTLESTAYQRARAEFMANIEGFGHVATAFQSGAAPTTTGTNARGQLTSRPAFRPVTLQGMWDKAEVGPNGGRLCSICKTYEAMVPPNSDLHTDWQGDHLDPWSKRVIRWDADRGFVIDLYQQRVQLTCPTCNRLKSDH